MYLHALSLSFSFLILSSLFAQLTFAAPAPAPAPDTPRGIKPLGEFRAGNLVERRLRGTAGYVPWNTYGKLWPGMMGPHAEPPRDTGFDGAVGDGDGVFVDAGGKGD